jgi:hypothetical protein
MLMNQKNSILHQTNRLFYAYIIVRVGRIKMEKWKKLLGMHKKQKMIGSYGELLMLSINMMFFS